MRLFPQRLQAELQNELYKHPEIPSLRSTGRPDLLDMVKRALDHRREERTEEVQEVEEGTGAKKADDDDGPGQREDTEEARDAEGERRSKTTEDVDGAAALDPALVGENSCWNCGTPGKEGNLCTCKGCRKVGQ